MDIAFQIRQNAQEYQAAASELLDWEKEMSVKEKTPSKSHWLPPVRNANPVKKEKIKGNDYRAWDKFNVEAELENVDYQVESKPVLEDDINKIQECLLQKEKGNAYFKRGDYKKSLVCYTKSIAADSTNVIPLVNRAMVHLKLNNYKQAESDCSAAIDFSPKNVKAFWRRGIARKHLGYLIDAQKDLEKALVFEPSNSSIKSELASVLELLSVDSTKKSEKRRRRLVIEEVGESLETVSRSFISSVSSNVPPSAETVTSLPLPIAKSLESLSIQSPVIQEIPRKVKQEVTVEQVKEEVPIRQFKEVKEEKPAIKAQRVPSECVFSIPSSLFEFERDWKSVRGNPEKLYKYIKQINPQDYAKLFKSSFESHYLSKFLEVIRDFYSSDPSETIKVLECLSVIPRFDMVIMFLSKADKVILSGIFETLPGDLNALKKSFGFKV